MTINKELLKGSTTILILTLLQGEDRYGYEMIREMERRSDGVFTLKEGTLYPILHTLESEGWLVSYWSEHEGRKRKYYRITKEGLRQLGDRKKEWTLFRTAVDKVIGEGTL